MNFRWLHKTTIRKSDSTAINFYTRILWNSQYLESSKRDNFRLKCHAIRSVWSMLPYFHTTHVAWLCACRQHAFALVVLRKGRLKIAYDIKRAFWHRYWLNYITQIARTRILHTPIIWKIRHSMQSLHAWPCDHIPNMHIVCVVCCVIDNAAANAEARLICNIDWLIEF